MIDKMYWACAGGLSLASQLGIAEALPPAEELQRRVSAMFDQMGRRCREVGIPEEDFNEARYAISAFIDEQVLKSEWPGRAQWINKPLQFLYFNENTAGEGFFQRITNLQAQTHRVHVLEIYYLCLALGFQGRYAARGGEGIAPVLDQVGAEVSRLLPPSDPISPHGDPQDGIRSFVRQERPIVALSLGFFGVALIVFIVLKVVLLASTSATATKMTRTFSVSAAAAPGKP